MCDSGNGSQRSLLKSSFSGEKRRATLDSPDSFHDDKPQKKPHVSSLSNIYENMKNLHLDSNSSTDGEQDSSLESHLGLSLDFRHTSAMPQFNSISPETLANLLEGSHDMQFDYIVTVDCRYDYEFNNGHIRNAINCSDGDIEFHRFRANSPNGNRVCWIFHCEFSSHRGPKAYTKFRDFDRKVNESNYPRITFREIYLLDGGYKAFFLKYPHLCDPSNYVPMEHPEFADQYKHIKKEKSKRKLRARQGLSRSSGNLFGENYKDPEDDFFSTIHSKVQKLQQQRNNGDDSPSPSLSRRNQTRKPKRAFHVTQSLPNIYVEEEANHRSNLTQKYPTFRNDTVLFGHLHSNSLSFGDSASSRTSPRNSKNINSNPLPQSQESSDFDCQVEYFQTNSPTINDSDMDEEYPNNQQPQQPHQGSPQFPRFNMNVQFYDSKQRSELDSINEAIIATTSLLTKQQQAKVSKTVINNAIFSSVNNNAFNSNMNFNNGFNNSTYFNNPDNNNFNSNSQYDNNDFGNNQNNFESYFSNNKNSSSSNSRHNSNSNSNSHYSPLSLSVNSSPLNSSSSGSRHNSSGNIQSPLSSGSSSRHNSSGNIHSSSSSRHNSSGNIQSPLSSSSSSRHNSSGNIQSPLSSSSSSSRHNSSGNIQSPISSPSSSRHNSSGSPLSSPLSSRHNSSGSPLSSPLSSSRHNSSGNIQSSLSSSSSSRHNSSGNIQSPISSPRSSRHNSSGSPLSSRHNSSGNIQSPISSPRSSRHNSGGSPLSSPLSSTLSGSSSSRHNSSGNIQSPLSSSNSLSRHNSNGSISRHNSDSLNSPIVSNSFNSFSSNDILNSNNLFSGLNSNFRQLSNSNSNSNSSSNSFFGDSLVDSLDIFFDPSIDSSVDSSLDSSLQDYLTNTPSSPGRQYENYYNSNNNNNANNNSNNNNNKSSLFPSDPTLNNKNKNNSPISTTSRDRNTFNFNNKSNNQSNNDNSRSGRINISVEDSVGQEDNNSENKMDSGNRNDHKNHNFFFGHNDKKENNGNNEKQVNKTLFLHKSYSESPSRSVSPVHGSLLQPGKKKMGKSKHKFGKQREGVSL